MTDRYYVGKDEYGKHVTFAWDLPHEPTPDNECGYEVVAGPFDDLEEAKLFVETR